MQASQATLPSRNSPGQTTSMESMDPVLRETLTHPQSRHSIQPIQTHLMEAPTRSTHDNIHNAIRIYEQTRFNDLIFPAPQVLTQAEYSDLYNYFAYELPFILTWGQTQAGNDYFMNKQRNLPADDILQYEAEQNARLLYNELHPNTPMQVLTPYEKITAEIKIQEPMPDEPPVPPPRVVTGTFSYVRGQEPPGTYPCGYQPFAGADPAGGGEGPTQPPQPPAAPQ